MRDSMAHQLPLRKAAWSDSAKIREVRRNGGVV